MTKLFSAIKWLTGMALMFACAAAVAAQPAAQTQSSGAVQGFQPNRDQPVKITANTLEVRDKIRQATFSGDVKLVQGERTVTTKALVVFYEDTQAQPAAKKDAQPDPQQAQKGASQQIKRAEAKGDVMITQKDQTATGDNGVFDIKSNTMTLTCNVVLTQGASVLRGERMIVDMASGVTKVYANAESGKCSRNQIEFMTNPSAKDKPAGSPKK